MEKKFNNKNIIIVGGTSGIGAATAFALAKQGANVIIAGRNIQKGKIIVDSIKQKFKVEVTFYQTDITCKDSIDNFFIKSLSDYSRIDGAFNCAGKIGNDSSLNGQRFHNSSETNWDNIFQTNLKGIWHCMRHELNHMFQNKNGSIVNCASIAGLKTANSRSIAYTASKHALIGLTRATAVEYARDNIRINAVCPGIIKTPILNDIPDEKLELLVQNSPGGRLGTPEEVANTVVFLLSDESSYINGSAMVVDAGNLCGAL
ncbi:MAG: SDR family oxidoreductase [Gammaproteobacteria bacterium]